MKTPTEAFEILDRIEYSHEGFVKRYPNEKDYEAALYALRESVERLVQATRTLVENGGIGPESMFHDAREALAPFADRPQDNFK